MKSLRVRLAVWSTLSFLSITIVFMVFTYRRLESELRNLSLPVPGDSTVMVDSRAYTEEQLRTIMTELVRAALLGSIPLVVAAITLGVLFTRESLSPVASINQQLKAIGPRSLGKRVVIREGDPQLKELTRQLNDMLSRLQQSFGEVSDYAAKVAHELRTPLTIVRLKIEQRENKIDPETAEELHDELLRLTYIVDQSLLLARAERGNLPLRMEPIDLRAVTSDLARDFELLLSEEGREIKSYADGPCRIVGDPEYTRQVAHALLTNAQMHGCGPVLCRIRERRGKVRLLVVNRVGTALPRTAGSLGMGLRVVRALLNRFPGVAYRRRFQGKTYAALVTFPSAPIRR